MLPSERFPLTPAPPAEPLRRHVAVLLGYLALALVVTWPLALDMQGAAIQLYEIPVDAGQGIWNLWWARESLLRGWNPYLSEHIYFPQRINLFFQTLSLPNALLVLPVLLAFGPAAAFNAVSLLSFALGGYFAYRLCRGLAGVAAALAGGFVFAFSAYHLQLLLVGAMEVIAIHWIPLYVLVLVRALRRPTAIGFIAAGSALALTTLASAYYGLYLAVYTAAHVALAALVAHRRGREAQAPGLSVASALRGLALLYAAWAAPVLLFAGPPDQLGASLMGDWYDRQVFQAAALVDYLALNTLHPLWGAWSAAALSAVSPAGVEAGAALGLTVYLLCGVALARSWRAAWPWGALALLAFVFSLGPELKVTGDPTGVPLPFALLDLLSPFRNSTRPNYWIGVLMLPVAALVALGLQALIGRAQRRTIAVAAAALLVFELWPRPLPLLPLAVDPQYAALRADEVEGAVLELPPRTNDSRAMLNQLCHARPLAGGYLARTPDYPPINGASAMRRLWFTEPEGPDIFRHDPAGELATLGVRFVVLNLDQMSGARAGQLRALLDAPGITSYAAGPRLEVYAVDPAEARPVVRPAAGWHAPETDGARVWRWMDQRAELRLIARRPSQVTLSLSATAYGRDRPLEIVLNDAVVATMQIPAAPHSRAVRLRLLVPAGAHRLELRSETETAPDGRRLSLSFGPLQAEGAALLPWPGQQVLAPPPTLSPGLRCS